MQFILIRCWFSLSEPNKTETLLQEMKKQLTQMQDDINILKGNKTFGKGKYKSFLFFVQQDLFLL